MGTITKKQGLKPKHHGELNSSWRWLKNDRARRVLELKSEYGDDLVALQQIDVYTDPTYQRKISEYAEALIANDTKKAKELERWFKKHYPDI